MVRNLRPGPTWIPASKAEQRGPLSYMVTVENGEQWRWHVDHLKPREESTFPRNEECLGRDSVILFESKCHQPQILLRTSRPLQLLPHHLLVVHIGLVDPQTVSDFQLIALEWHSSLSRKEWSVFEAAHMYMCSHVYTCKHIQLMYPCKSSEISLFRLVTWVGAATPRPYHI